MEELLNIGSTALKTTATNHAAKKYLCNKLSEYPLNLFRALADLSDPG